LVGFSLFRPGAARAPFQEVILVVKRGVIKVIRLVIKIVEWYNSITVVVSSSR